MYIKSSDSFSKFYSFLNSFLDIAYIPSSDILFPL